MRQVITAKLKLLTTPEQFRALRQTQVAYRNALNSVSRYAFAHGKMSNQMALQQACYDNIRSEHRLPAQMACNVPRQVGATYRTLWTKVKANADARRAGLTRRRYKGLDQAPKYISPTLTYNYQWDFSFKTEQRVSILSLDGRMIVLYGGYGRHIALIQNGAQIDAAKLWYDKPHKRFYLLVSIEVEMADPLPENKRGIVGVDVGQRYLAVATDTQNRTAFYPGKPIQAKADHYVRLRKRLQQKGTRSATQRLIGIAGRERRLKQDRNHLTLPMAYAWGFSGYVCGNPLR
jgi:predicted transposase